MKTSNCCSRPGVFIVLLVVSLLPQPAQGTTTGMGSYLQREWHSDSGLPCDSVHAVVQTHDGYIWVGTRRGLCRFDGVRFVPLDDLPQLRNESISNLLEDSKGGLWIGTERGLLRFKDGRITRYAQTNGLAGDNVRTVYEGRDGTIWIGTTSGLSQWRNGHFRNLAHDEGLPNNVVRSVCEDGAGTLWIATDAGICQLKNGAICVPADTLELDRSGRAICLDADGNLCVGTVGGLYRRHGKSWEHFTKASGGLPDNFISALYLDRNRQLWVGTYGGLSRILDGACQTEWTDKGDSFDLVNTIMEDREGNVWIGSKEGLTRLKTRSFTSISKEQGLTCNNIMSVLESKRGTYWCGTWGGGLFELKEQRLGFLITNSFPNSRIISLCEARDGSLWFGMDFGEGLFRLKGTVLTRYDNRHGLEKVGVRVIYEDRETNLWVGTRVLNLIKDGKLTRYTTNEGLTAGSVRAILEDKTANLWVGTSEGLSRRTRGSFTSFTKTNGLSHNMVVSLYEDKDDNLWVGTAEGGLNRLRNGRFTAYTTRDGLFSNEVLEILEDDDDFLWMSSLKGIFRVSKRALDQFDRREIESIPCVGYGKDDGMISIICGNVSKPAAWKGHDGRLWFATTKGVVVVDPRRKTNTPSTPVLIEEILADGRTVLDPFGRCRAATELLIHGSQLDIPPGRGGLEIHYSALNFRAPEKFRFRYKLGGVDPDWVNAGTRRVAYYNNLTPGQYEFSVVTCGADGMWNPSAATIRLFLQPHYWQTWWFKGFGMLGSFSIVAWWARFLTRRRMERKLERLKQQHAIERERARIAKDIHDDLGASLTRITFLGELAEVDKGKPEAVANYVQRIVSTARETVRSLDEIVWAVNPRKDTLNSFIEYVAHYANEFLSSTELLCHLDLPETVPDITLSSEVRHSLFLIVKEFLNNSVKHARATEISIHMALNQRELVVELGDDGCGFDFPPHPAKPRGNGLENMRKRVESLGGVFKLDSRPGTGTRLWFEVTLPDPSHRKS